MAVYTRCWRVLVAAFVVCFLSVATASAEQVKTAFQVNNLSCGSCLSTIGDGLSTMAGVTGMGADLGRRMVFVRHDSAVAPEDIAQVMTDLGYPAIVVSQAAAADEAAREQAAQQPFRPSGGCGGCGPAGQGGAARMFAPPVEGSEVTTVVLKVDNLSCISCLTTIGDALQQVVGAVSMRSDLAGGLIAVEYDDRVDADELAATVTDAGYPARVVGNGQLAAFVTADPGAPQGGVVAGSGCGTRPCNATAAAWSQLYKKFLGGDAAN